MEKDVDKRILKAALEVVSKEKISGTRMHIIAKEANMSQANLHYHFSTKNDIMVALLNSIQEEFSKGRKNYIDTEAKTVTENIQGFFEQKKDDILINKKMEYAQIDYWVQGTVNEEIRTIFQNTFNIWRKSIEETFSKEEQEGIDDKTMKNIPFVMVSLMLGASLQYLIDEGKFDLDDYFQVAEEMILTACNKTK
ncbi:TetR family transcriptional regulator [Clostridium sulfidigenes]|uniref:TetR family transcriptional regulator n=1 Tax=Clostridium sulfidigenes TaxID=318464 RepID=A0A084JAA4_9CLOT|nr:TetR/AcrR family transcriptional regulator [Clostridium sulfidigenes]KEZ85888.1 TetR family transcriptional regulator [Clostridium sulfidigenes]